MIHIVITAGGTIENIDTVRKIANSSTGRLGTFLCSATLNYFEKHDHHQEFQIHYIVAQSAIKPTIKKQDEKHVVFYETTDTKSVMNTIYNILDKYKVNYFIHSMAISDFTTDHITPIELLAKEITEKINEKLLNNESVIDNQFIENILRNPISAINKTRKISSKSDLSITLIRTPKIISLIKELDPEVFLVGFKLLNHVSEEKLIEVATTLSKKNHCDLVLANDMQYIKDHKHLGLLIENGKVVNRYSNKREIAEGIIYEMFNRRPI